MFATLLYTRSQILIAVCTATQPSAIMLASFATTSSAESPNFLRMRQQGREELSKRMSLEA